MPSWPPLRFSSWSCDENNRLILLKVPEQIRIDIINENPLPPSLSTLDKYSLPPRTAPTLPTLPPEIAFTILHHLPPVDRVCLALTCRRLCATVLASPRLTPETWLRFTNITDFTNRYFNPSVPYLTLAPEHYQLCQRLAHGWVDKKTWRYCWKCHKILPRDAEWWWNSHDRNGHKRIHGRKNPRWGAKTGVDKDEWFTWSKKKRLKWLVDVWCKARWEDSSVISCDWCRDKFYVEDVERMQLEFSEPKNATLTKSGELDVMSFVGTRHPVECPSCLERELTFSWRPPKRVIVKKAFWSIVGCLRDWCVGCIWCAGGIALALVMFIFEVLHGLGRMLRNFVVHCIPGGRQLVDMCSRGKLATNFHTD